MSKTPEAMAMCVFPGTCVS